ncbi:BQ5605_C005g03375 [Microbotryum silenes-dioicae]|uniref:BQ5605_C005g03375 protein n=1 Tax=Microbotryum silenes-dioicae TaxID=796604 RepID=A0A2X0MAG8_9BASI|nr:BQ5605_C005g03375 [Microbotryum silenes-dioicae]
MSFFRHMLCQGSDDGVDNLFATASARDTSNVPVAHWDPSDEIPRGFKSHVQHFEFGITNDSSVKFESMGAWANGTLQLSHAWSNELLQLQQRSESDEKVCATLTSDVKGHDSESMVRAQTMWPGWPWHWWSRKRQEVDEWPMRGNPDGLVVQIRVEARYNNDSLWKESNIIATCDDSLNVTLLVETPERLWDNSRKWSRLDFHTTVRTSSAVESLKLLSVQNSSSDSAPPQRHDWKVQGDVSLKNICFDRVDVRTKNSPISFDYLEADDVDLATTNAFVRGKILGARVNIQTSNSSISGDFEGCEGLRVQTTNASISGLYKVGESSDGVLLKTTNEAIRAQVEVFEQEDEKKIALRDPVKIEAQSTNASVNLDVVRSPPRAKIDWTVASSNGPLRLKYPAPFDGSFQVRTSNSSRTQVIAPGSHNIRYNFNTNSHKEGLMSSGLDPANRGNVRLVATTSNASAELVVA